MDDFEAFEARRFFCELAVGVDGEGDAFLPEILDPNFEVVGAMPRRGMYKTGAGVVGDVIAGEEWDGEGIRPLP